MSRLRNDRASQHSIARLAARNLANIVPRFHLFVSPPFVSHALRRTTDVFRFQSYTHVDPTNEETTTRPLGRIRRPRDGAATGHDRYLEQNASRVRHYCIVKSAKALRLFGAIGECSVSRARLNDSGSANEQRLLQISKYRWKRRPPRRESTHAKFTPADYAFQYRRYTRPRGNSALRPSSVS